MKISHAFFSEAKAPCLKINTWLPAVIPLFQFSRRLSFRRLSVAVMQLVCKARRTWRGKCSAKWHECHFAQENSRRVRMIFAEEILICVAEENIYHV